MSHNDTLTRAVSLRELIESEANKTEADGTMSPDIVDALDQQGLFRLVAPKEYGGIAADIPTIVDVTAALSFADGSTGWAFAQNTTVMAYTAYLQPEFARPLAEATAAAGMFAPLGTAQIKDGGYDVQGNYQFGSGSGHAKFMGGAALVMNGDDMVFKDDGRPELIGFIVPADKVELKGNWDVMGLNGTGSYDFHVPEQFVETGQTFSVFDPKIIAGGNFYAMGPISLGTISSCGWAMGVARRALHEITTIANAGRARLGSDPLAQQQAFQRALGEHSMAVEAADTYIKKSYQSLLDILDGSAAAADIAQQNRVTRAAGSWGVRIAREAVTFAWQASGSSGMRNPSILQRCFRDIQVGAGHQVFDEKNYEEVIKESLGLEPSAF